MVALWSAAVLLLVLNTEDCRGVIQITENPQNQTALVGQTQPVVFQCKYTGTRSLPRWQINGRDYTGLSLPYWYRNIRQGLQVQPILESMNKTKYICFFVTFVERIESHPAFLIVHTGSEDSSMQEDATPTSMVSLDVPTPTSVTTAVSMLGATLYATTKSASLHDNAISAIQPTATSPLTATEGSCLHQRATTTPEITSQPQVPQTEYLLLYSGISVAVVITALFSITLLVILVICHSKRKKALSERENIAMKPNAAYERPRQRFQMQRNEAYDHVHPPPRPESPVYCTVSALTEH